jgi:type I restriction enzyme S subunit
MSFRGYPDYKSSGFDWMGEIPFAWFILPLKRAFEIIGGSTPSADEINWGGPIQWATPADLSKLSSPYIQSTRRTLSHLGRASCGCSLLPTRSIILSTRAPIGSLAINTEPMSTNQGCKGLVPYRDISSVFFAYVLSISTELLNNLGKGTTFLEISGDELGRFPAAFPTFPEQTQIARFLDHETAKIDTLIHEQKRLIELLKEKRQAVISHAVTKGLDPDVPMKDSGVEWLGEIPAHWAIRKLNQFSPIITCGVAATPEYFDDGVRFLSAQNVKKGQVDLSKGCKRISAEKHLELTKNREPKNGDILLSRVGTVGEACIINVPFRFSIFVSLTHLRLDQKICSNVFFIHLCESRYVKSLHSAVTLVGGGVGNLNVNDLREYLLPIPPVSEQVKISDYLKKEVKGYSVLIKQAETGITLLQERRSALISAAVTGKIDVRNWQPPADESAFDEEVQQAGMEAKA